MNKPTRSAGTPLADHRPATETPNAAARPDPMSNQGLDELIEIAQRQSKNRLTAKTQDSSRPQTPVGADDTAGPIHVQPPSAWIGAVLIIVAVGVAAQAWIGYRARVTGNMSPILWYISLCAIYVPSASIVMSRHIPDRARVWLTLYMSVALLATRFMLYPTQFAYFDELVNYRTLLSIESSRHLFTPNSLLPATAYYPGMEIATSGIHQLTGLSLHASGIAILGIARVIMTLALIRVVQLLTGKTTVGCLAALIYAANPQYLFFNSQFSYQSVALPLCFFCIYAFAIQRTPRRIINILPVVSVVAAIAVTHHLTSLALIVLLWTWYIFTKITKRPVSKLLPLAAISLAIVAAWTWLARSVIVPYIAEILNNSVVNIRELLNGNASASHRAFTDAAGSHNPLWEELFALGSVVIILVALIPALYLAIIKHRLMSAAAMVLFAVAALYPMIPAGHVTTPTAEVADRSAGFVFVGLGYLIATWWYRDIPFHRHARNGRFTVPRHKSVLTLGLTICFVGGTVIGSGPTWLYGPGSYLVSADNRSVDQLALQAAYWEGQNLPPDSRVYTDRVNSLLASAYGDQHVLTSLGDHISEWELSTLLLAPLPPNYAVRFACEAHLEYLISDNRLASGLPHVQFYISSGEYQSGSRASPPTLTALTKFAKIPGVQTVFDNGAIVIYDLRGLSCGGRK